jgi:hypothetical protein
VELAIFVMTLLKQMHIGEHYSFPEVSKQCTSGFGNRDGSLTGCVMALSLVDYSDMGGLPRSWTLRCGGEQ